MKIKTEWAKKINTVPYASLEQGTYYIGPTLNWKGQKICQKDSPNREIVVLNSLDGIHVDPHHVIPLGDWDQMCTWCANGYKIEDLYLDPMVKNIPVSEMTPGMVAQVVYYHLADTLDIGSILMRMGTPPFNTIMIGGEGMLGKDIRDIFGDTEGMTVRPLGPGDSISITFE